MNVVAKRSFCFAVVALVVFSCSVHAVNIEVSKSLVHYAKKGHWVSVGGMLNIDADVNYLVDGCSALYWVSYNGSMSMADHLLDRGATGFGSSPALAAVSQGHFDVLVLLLYRGMSCPNFEVKLVPWWNDKQLTTAQQCIKLALGIARAETDADLDPSKDLLLNLVRDFDSINDTISMYTRFFIAKQEQRVKEASARQVILTSAQSSSDPLERMRRLFAKVNFWTGEPVES
jgi:hypothetical protein